VKLDGAKVEKAVTIKNKESRKRQTIKNTKKPPFPLKTHLKTYFCGLF
jgi:hypothetical protein